MVMKTKFLFQFMVTCLLLPYPVFPQGVDYGDAPDPGFPTMAYNLGASHIVDGITYLGALCDGESDGIPDTLATGDDNYGMDDEDGVTFPSIMFAGTTVTLSVTASVQGYLNAWIDFNNNGTWTDVGEHAIYDQLIAGGTSNISLPIPASSVIDTVYARFRFCSYSGISYDGRATDGEVEDYRMIISSNVATRPGIADANCDYRLRPNPVSGSSIFSFEANKAGTLKIRSFSISGKKIEENECFATTGHNDIKLSSLFSPAIFRNRGLYILEITSEHALPCRIKMMVW